MSRPRRGGTERTISEQDYSTTRVRGVNLVGRPLTVERLRQIWRALPFAMILEADKRGQWPSLEEQCARLEAPFPDGPLDR